MDLRKVFLNFETLLFVCGQVAAGALNYLFQVYGARTMPNTDFGSWSHWLAQFSVACFAGVWLQSVAVISDSESLLPKKVARGLLLALSSVLLTAYLISEIWVMSVAGWGLSLLSGFLFGLNLRRKNMHILAAASFLTPTFKFLWIFADHGANNFYMATLVAPVSACLVFLFWPKQIESTIQKNEIGFSSSMLLSALCLAFFSAWTPQVDLIMVAKILSVEEFGIYAKVALLSKGFFFCFQILAQMVLAHQVQSSQNRLTIRVVVVLAFLGGVVTCAGIIVAKYFGWPESWAMLSLLHVTSLCLIYILIQDFAAMQDGKWSLILCLTSVTLVFVFANFFPLVWYWISSIILEIFVLACGFYLLPRIKKTQVLRS